MQAFTGSSNKLQHTFPLHGDCCPTRFIKVRYNSSYNSSLNAERERVLYNRMQYCSAHTNPFDVLPAWQDWPQVVSAETSFKREFALNPLHKYSQAISGFFPNYNAKHENQKTDHYQGCSGTNCQSYRVINLRISIAAVLWPNWWTHHSLLYSHFYGEKDFF